MVPLEEEELSELARFFSRRFATAEELQTLEAAGVRLPDAADRVSRWKALLTSPQRHRAIARVAALRPDDTNVQEICQILLSDRRQHSRWVAAGASIAGAALTVILFWGFQRPAEAPSPPTPELVATVAYAAAPAPVIAPEPSHLEIVPVPRPPPEPERVTGADPRPSASPRAEVTPHVKGACRGAPDDLIGYWYAGVDAPGASGETITVPVPTNVRADYPDAHNGFNARAAVRCVLVKGTRLTLKADPIAVPGDRYWVPLHGADLMAGR